MYLILSIHSVELFIKRTGRHHIMSVGRESVQGITMILFRFSCDGEACTTANAARWNLYNNDVTLYGLLLEVYFNGNVNVVAGLAPCTQLQ